MPTALLAFAAALGLLLAPGWVTARACRVRGLAALGAAPALSVAWIAVATVLTAWQGQRWSWVGFVCGMFEALVPVVLCALAWGVWGGKGRQRPRVRHRVAGRNGHGRRTPEEGVQAQGTTARRGGRAGESVPECWASWDRAQGAGLIGAGCAALMTVVPMWQGIASLTRAPQASDAIFHMSAVAFVRESGNASFLGGLAPMYDGRAVYYPTAWHAIAALLPGDTALGANVLLLVVAGLVWPLGMAALISTVLQACGVTRPALVGVGAALAGSVVSVELLASSVWPYTLSVALLPGALALAVPHAARLRHWCGGLPAYIRHWGRQEYACAMALVGVVLAHGTGAFNLVVLAVPLCSWALAPHCRAVWAQARHRRLLATMSLFAVAALGTTIWLMRAPLEAVFTFSRGAANILETLFGVVSDHPLLATYTAWIPGNVLIFLLACVGVSSWKRLPAARPWVMACALSITLVLLAGGPAWWGRILAGPWYTQRARLMPLVSLTMLTLAALGLARLDHGLRQRGVARCASASALDSGEQREKVRCRGNLTDWLQAAAWRLPAVVLVSSLVVAPGWRWPLKSEIMASIHEPEHIAYGQMLGPGEEALVRQARHWVAPGQVVVGDPSNGSAYLWALGGVEVLYPSRPQPRSGTELSWMGARLTQLNWNWQLCMRLRSRGVEYYYADRDPAGRVALWGKHWDVPPSVLMPVARGGTATLYRINWSRTVCGTMPGPDGTGTQAR